MADTLADADAVFCTNNAASKVNLYTNFRPKLLVCDEACRATELSILSAFAFYKPEAWIFAGDPRQMRPTILSAEREKDWYAVKFLNPFYRQGLLPFMHRMATVGHPVQFLAKQHQC